MSREEIKEEQMEMDESDWPEEEVETEPASGVHRKTLALQICSLFIGVFLLAIAAIVTINALFLEEYYISRKIRVLQETIVQVENVVESQTCEDLPEPSEQEDELEFFYDGVCKLDIPDELMRFFSGNNLSLMILDDNQEPVFQNVVNQKLLYGRIFGYLFDMGEESNDGDAQILRQTDKYRIQKVRDRFMEMDYLEAWGELTDDYTFILRTPLESMVQSASISNTFYLAVGLLVLAAACVLICLFTLRIIRPVTELTHLSERMANLEFDARYTLHAGNEIDELGENFNAMSAQLEKTISELKSANNKLQEDIADKIKIDQMRKEFLDNVSHELKTPIALVQGYAEGLLEGISDDPESTQFYAEVIMDEAGKMNKLVKNLLSLNKLESGRDEVTMERFDLVTLIRGVLGSMDIMLSGAEANVIFEAEAPCYVWADEFKTEEVLTNYISNAIHHLEGEKQIEIRIRDEEKSVRISVFNTGKPIPEEDLQNVWNKFYKVDKAHTREYGGSGIGLSIVKAIMESMHQSCGVHNYDNGVEFWFTLDRESL